MFIEELIPAFPAGETQELRLPIDEERLEAGGVLEVFASMRSDGPVEFTGLERIRMQLGLDGTYEVIVP